MNNLKPSVALVDDHVLLRNGLANLIRSFGEYSVLFEACNGNDLYFRVMPSEPQCCLVSIHVGHVDVEQDDVGE